jgi:hypothetical protein
MSPIYAFIIFFDVSQVFADLEFVAFGDWGYAGKSFDTVVNSFRSQCPNREFVLLLGDKYPSGFRSVNDADWSLFTEGVAKGSSVSHHSVLGNHDYMGDPDVEVAYSKIDSRWDMPSRYYTRIHTNGSTTVCITAIDTNDFNPDQIFWLSNQFSNPKCDPSTAWNIVIGHHPIWSAGLYSDTTQLKRDLVPILHQNKVDLYLCGHDHIHEIFYDGSVTEVVSGAVAIMRAPVTFQQHEYQVWGVSGWNVEGYLKLTASGSSGLTVEIKSARSNLNFQQFTITKDGNKQSIFGHISWSRQQSNRDAVIADGITPITTKSALSCPIFSAIMVFFIVIL